MLFRESVGWLPLILENYYIQQETTAAINSTMSPFNLTTMTSNNTTIISTNNITNTNSTIANIVTSAMGHTNGADILAVVVGYLAVMIGVICWLVTIPFYSIRL